MGRIKTKSDLRKAQLQFAFFRVFERLLGLLPVAWVFNIGKGIGGLCYSFFKKKRVLVEENVNRAFPLSMADENSRVKTIFQNVGANLLASVRIGFISKEKLSEHYTWVENEAYHQIVKADHPRVVLLGHVSNWELLSRAVAQLTTNTGALYRALDNPYLDELVKRRRQKDGMQLCSKRKGLIQAMKILKGNGLLGILVDQYVHAASSEVSIFGETTNVSRMPEMIVDKLSQSKSAAPARVYYLSLKATRSDHWQLEFHQAPEDEPLDVGRAIEWFYSYSPLEVFFFHRLWRNKK